MIHTCLIQPFNFCEITNICASFNLLQLISVALFRVDIIRWSTKLRPELVKKYQSVELKVLTANGLTRSSLDHRVLLFTFHEIKMSF